MHPEPADCLDDLERALAVVEHVEDRRHRADVLRESPVPHQVADDPEQLGEHDPDDLGPVRHVDAGQLLQRREVGQIVHHAAEVVDAVGVWDVGVPGLALAHLLGAAVVEADVGDAVDYLLAASWRTTRNGPCVPGCCGPEVEKHVLLVPGLPLHAPFLGPERQVSLECLALFLAAAGKGPSRSLELGGPSAADGPPTMAASGSVGGSDARRSGCRTCPRLRARTSSPSPRGR